jgi:hypothetical protein
MNPYAKFLGARDAREVIGQTPGRLTALAQQLGPAGLERPLAPGKWPARAIISHLADCEVVFAYRLRQALAEDHHVIQPFDQDVWAAPYTAVDPHAALAVFSAVHRWNEALLGTVTPDQLAKTLNHPERGDMTFQTVIETMAGHDLNHLEQLETIASAN